MHDSMDGGGRMKQEARIEAGAIIIIGLWIPACARMTQMDLPKVSLAGY